MYNPPPTQNPITKEEFDALASTLRQCLEILRDFRHREKTKIDDADKAVLTKILFSLESTDIVKLSSFLTFQKIKDLVEEISRLPEADRPIQIIKRVSPKGGRPTYMAARPK